MSYQYPPNNQVNFTWVGFDEYAYPSPTSANLAWYNYGCDYLTNLPTSPNVTFVLNQSNGYIGFSGSVVDFNLICDVPDIATIYISGNNLLNQISFSGDPIVHWATPWTLSGNSFFSDFNLESLIAVEVIGSGDNYFTITTSSVVDRGNWVRSNARITSPISSSGYVEMTPIVIDSNCTIGSNIISSENEVIVVGVVELKNNLAFSSEISHLRGRVLFGYPDPNIIRQAYELSDNRSLNIPNVPEDPSYAVFLSTTNFNLTDEEIRRGTVEMAFTFDHDVKDIRRISVWVMNPQGHAFRDKMRVFDYPGGNIDDHILFDPFLNSSVLRIPIHCISKKENQFYIEIEYKNSAVDQLDPRPRTMRQEEKYIIPFQAHFDNRNPYINAADSTFLNGPEKTENTFFNQELENIGPVYFIPDEDSTGGTGAHATNISNMIHYYEEISRIFCITDDLKTNVSQAANSNTYFIQEYIDLSSIQIGG